MLSTRPLEGRVRRARNLLPTDSGGLEARPGALQLATGNVTDVQVWGTRLLLERDGRLVLLSGTVLTDVGPAGRFVRGTPFQALTANAEREERLYVADGLNPLWYLARRGGQTVRESVVNTVTDAAGLPYPLPVPSLVATWRGRVWCDEGPNRLRHCQFDAPAQWDPLWTVEVQGAASDRLRALRAHGEMLLVGLEHAVWAVTGTSQYDWRAAAVVNGRGCAGPRSLTGDGDRAWLVARDGVFALGGAAPLSDDVREAFGVAHMDSAAVMEPREQRLYVRVGGRLLALHVQTGRWGEVVAAGARGLFVLDGRVGWYGQDGVWVMAGRDEPDVSKAGVRTPVQALMESWDEVPNRAAGGRALLNRVRLYLQGSTRGSATYTATADGDRSAAFMLDLADVTADTWQQDAAPADGDGEAWPPPGVLREVVPRLAGRAFRHRLEASCYVRMDSFDPEYRFRGAA